MAKLQDYDWSNLPQEAIDFKDDVTRIINYGKYSAPVLTSAPNWQGREGEHCYTYIVNGTGWDFYTFFWINSGWVYMQWLGTNTNAAYAWTGLQLGTNLYTEFVALSDRQVQSINIAIAGVGSDNIAAQSILAAHLTAGELVTLSAQIKDGIITNAKINDLAANKIVAGTIGAYVIVIGSAGNAGRVVIEGANQTIKVYDTAGTLRVELGKLT